MTTVLEKEMVVIEHLHLSWYKFKLQSSESLTVFFSVN